MKIAPAALLVGLAFTLDASAAQIGIGDFSGSETVTTFNGLGLPVSGNSTPLVLDGNSYTTDDGLFRYLTISGCSSECIGSNSGSGYIDVLLGAPSTRVGARVGLASPWAGFVEFFDTTDTLLATISYPSTSGLQFAGWEDAAGISRFRVTDTTSSSVIAMDDFRFEGTVPEPAVVLLWACGLLALAHRQRA